MSKIQLNGFVFSKHQIKRSSQHKMRQMRRPPHPRGKIQKPFTHSSGTAAFACEAPMALVPTSMSRTPLGRCYTKGLTAPCRGEVSGVLQR